MFIRQNSSNGLSILLGLSLTLISFALARGQQTVAAPEPPPAAPPAPDTSKSSSTKTESAKPESDKPEKSSGDAKAVSRESADKDKEKRPAGRTAEKAEPKPVVRLLELSGQYVDSQQPLALDPTNLLLGGESLKQKSFYRLCTYLEEIAKDAQVAHVVFDLSDANLVFNPAQLDELTRRLERLKASGKQTLAWLENPSNVQLAIAAACSQVILADFGVVDMPSLSMQSLFYRDAMDLVGVQASVVRAGDFKGAVEPYLNPHMSEHLKQHYIDMLKSINDAQVDRLARGRGLTVAQVRQLQQKRLLLPEQALAEGLVDRLAPYGSMKSTIDQVIGKSLEWTKPKTAPQRDVSLFELFGKLMSSDKKTTSSTKEGTLAVLHLSGTIEDGKKESSGSIVSGPTVKTIEELAKDDKIKGVVVRINSPGGSATASEAIRRALVTLTERKPTIVSMGEMAASGGYWISCIGQPVYAEKGTITGSIGVFSLKLSLGTMLRRVGVHVESIALDDSAKSDSLDRPWSERDVSSMQSFVDDVYGKFLKLVSQSRNIPVDQLQSLAGGRVWSGTQAKQHRLIDEIGGLDDCLAAVAKKAKLDKYEIIHRPIAKSGFDLMELLGEDDPNEIAISSLIPTAAVRWATSQGLNLRNTSWLLRQSMNGSTAAPQVWALSSEEISIR